MAGTRCSRSLLLTSILLCATNYFANGATMTCHSIVQAGHRCRWPDEGLECHCIPNAECAQGSNACRCIPGYDGLNCDRSCPYDDNGRCLRDCHSSPYCLALLSCRQDADICMCKNGYTGKDCNLCDHTILPNCTNCPYQKCENRGKCNLVTWQCACEDGYQGSYCSLCYPTLHPTLCGEHCDLTCVNSYCNTHTGDCSCPHGFDAVANCSFCDPSRVSDGCMRFCHTICRAGGLCNVEQQRCMCKDGYVGDDCRLCDPRTHPTQCVEHCPSLCQNNGYCDVLSRACMCQPGYEVTYNCELCRPSLHSEACVNHCDPTCKNGGDCLSSQGFCICPLGYILHDCTMCIPHLQARNCTDHCPLCDNNATCDTLSGQCICTAGWWGVSCADPCPTGTFGVGCQPCDCRGHPCDVFTGACLIQPTTPAVTTTMKPTTVAVTTRESATTLQSTTIMTTTVVTTGFPTTLPASVIEESFHAGPTSVTTSTGIGQVRTQQAPEEIVSLLPGLILENQQNFSSTYVVAIVISALILIILLSPLVIYLMHDRRRKHHIPSPGPEEVPLNNVVTNNLENGRSSNIYTDSILPNLTAGEESVDGSIPDSTCCNRKSLSEEQVQRLSRISGDLAFFAKVPNAIAANKVPNRNLFSEVPGSNNKFGGTGDGDSMKPTNTDQDASCKASGGQKGDDCCKDAGMVLEPEPDALLGACGGVDPKEQPDATSTPKRPKSRDSRVYEVIINHLPHPDPTENRNARMSGEYYLLEPSPAWCSSNSSESDTAKAFQDDQVSQGTNPRVSADSGIEQAVAPFISPHYEQLERPVNLVQPQSPTPSRTDKSDDERDSGVYAHLSRAPSTKGYNKLEFSPRRERKHSDKEFFSENQYGRLNVDGNDDSQSD